MITAATKRKAMRKYYDYNEYLSDCHTLTSLIHWEFDTIIAIARGGLTLSHMLGEFYDIRHVYAINTIGYNDTQKLETIEVFNIPNLKYAKNVLIVDDIVDSGDTMKIVLEMLREKYPECLFRSAVLFYKPTAVIKPDWYAKEPEEWIDFFWSDDLSREA